MERLVLFYFLDFHTLDFKAVRADVSRIAMSWNVIYPLIQAVKAVHALFVDVTFRRLHVSSIM